MAVTMFSAVFDDGYGTDAIRAIGPPGSVVAVIDPTSLDTLTIRPAGARSSSGSIALVTATTPKTLVWKTSRSVATVVWLGLPDPSPRAIPALLIKMSSTPNSVSIHFAACCAEASSVTSSWTNLASAPPARSSRSACCPRPASLAPASTVMPRAPSSLAVWRPMPLLAPVISAVVVMAPSSARTRTGGRALPRLGSAVPPCARRDGAPESSRTNADDRLPLASLGRVEGGDGIVEGRDVADVRPQPSVTRPPDNLTQLGAIGHDNEVDRQAVGGPCLGRPGDRHQRSSGPDHSCGPLRDVAAEDIEHQIDSADVFQGVVLEVDELLGAEVEHLLTVGSASRTDDVGAGLTCELGYHRTDCAGRAVHEDALPRVKVAVLEQSLPRSQSRHRHTRTHREVDVARQRREVACLDGHILRQGAAAIRVREAEHSLSHRQPRRAVAESGDHSGQLLPGNRRCSITVEAIGPGRGPRQLIPGESRRMNLNDDVVYRCLRLGPLHQLHPGRSRSLLRHHDRLHRSPPRVEPSPARLPIHPLCQRVETNSRR